MLWLKASTLRSVYLAKGPLNGWGNPRLHCGSQVVKHGFGKEVARVAWLETADTGGVTGAISDFLGCLTRVYFPFGGTQSYLEIQAGAKSGYGLILALGIVQPGLLLPLPKSGL